MASSSPRSLEARIRRAQVLLETTSQSVERIGAHVGFRSPVPFREHFGRATATSPTA
jgi:transcriptional regulator GlxA family with amidase domain